MKKFKGSSLIILVLFISILFSGLSGCGPGYGWLAKKDSVLTATSQPSETPREAIPPGIPHGLTMGSPQLGAQQGPPGGMGARFLEENGRKAIAELFKRTFA